MIGPFETHRFQSLIQAAFDGGDSTGTCSYHCYFLSWGHVVDLSQYSIKSMLNHYLKSYQIFILVSIDIFSFVGTCSTFYFHFHIQWQLTANAPAFILLVKMIWELHTAPLGSHSFCLGYQHSHFWTLELLVDTCAKVCLPFHSTSAQLIHHRGHALL